MAKHRDRYKATTPATVRYRRGESWSERHQRRFRINLRFLPDARRWCRERSIAFEVTHSGHHWQFEVQGVPVDWWPASAKCVVNKKFESGIHVHDWPQLIPILERLRDVPAANQPADAGPG